MVADSVNKERSILLKRIMTLSHHPRLKKIPPYLWQESVPLPSDVMVPLSQWRTFLWNSTAMRSCFRVKIYVHCNAVWEESSVVISSSQVGKHMELSDRFMPKNSDVLSDIRTDSSVQMPICARHIQTWYASHIASCNFIPSWLTLAVKLFIIA